MKALLSQSKKFKLFALYEEAFLESEDLGRTIIVGDFYGSPDCGVIGCEEKWCVTGGNGLVVYYLAQPFSNYELNKVSTQWKELFRGEVDSPWYPEAIYQIDETTVRLVMDMNSTARGVYDLNVYSLELTQLL